MRDRDPSTPQVLALSAQAHAPLWMTERAINLRAGFGDFGKDFLFFLFFGRAAEEMFGEAVAEEGEGVFGRVDELEEVEVVGRDGAAVAEGLEVLDAVPVFPAF